MLSETISRPPGLLHRLGMAGFGLLLAGFAVWLYGVEPIAFYEISIVLPLLLSWLALLPLHARELRAIGQHLRSRPALVSVSASRQALRAIWRHTWQFGLLLLLISGLGALTHIQETPRTGHFMAVLLIGLVYLVVLKAVLLMPLEIALARRGEELALRG